LQCVSITSPITLPWSMSSTPALISQRLTAVSNQL
jgi:hypothetical protein